MNNSILSGNFYNYTYIDHGAQFRVYAIMTYDNQPTGRVIKVPLGFAESHEVLAPHLRLLGYDESNINHTVHNLMLKKQQLPLLLQGLYARDHTLMRLLADTKIVPLLSSRPTTEPQYTMPVYFTQEYIIPMSSFLHQFRFAQLPPYHVEMKRIKYLERLLTNIIELHYRLWEYGIFELSFKLENIGIRQNNNSVVLVDIGEYTTRFDVANARLQVQPWLYPLQVEKTDHLFLPPFIHNFYTHLFEEAFTSAELQKRWCRKSNHLEQRHKRLLKLRELITHDPHKEMALWVERQDLHKSLYSGIPLGRIDDLEIPYNDIEILLRDRWIGNATSTIRTQEFAERQYFKHLVDRQSGMDISSLLQMTKY